MGDVVIVGSRRAYESKQGSGAKSRDHYLIRRLAC